MYSQIKEPFEIRYDTIIKGKFTTIGNNTLSKESIAPFNTIDDVTNGDIDMVNVDIDNDPTTFNSSSAKFANPNLECFYIKKALLYWTATDVEKNTFSGDPIDNQPNWEFNHIKLQLPNDNTYTTLIADDIIFRGRDFHISNDPYACVKDITTLVQKNDTPFGTYQVANVESATGQPEDHIADMNSGAAGGWQIIFIYEYLDAPAQRITLFDGYNDTSASNEAIFNIKGFQTVPRGNVNASILFGALEGDQPLKGDALTIKKKNTTDFIPIGDNTVRLKDNFFNSSITINDNVFLDRTPASENTLGFDAGLFKLDNSNNEIIGNSQNETTLKMTSSGDNYGLYLFGFSIEVYQPDLAPIVLTTDSGDAQSPIEIIPEENLKPVNFSLTFRNNGNDDAKNVKLSTVLPSQVEFIPPSPVPTGISFNVNATTNALDILIDNVLVKSNGDDVAINYSLGIKENCYFLTQDCDDLTFKHQFTATYSGDKNQNTQTTVSSNTIDDCLIGNLEPLTFEVIPQAPFWTSKQGDLDTKISCDDTKGLENAQKLEPNASCAFNLKKISGKFIPDNSNCANNGTYINTWTFTDKCSLSSDIKAFKQVITIYDNIGPDLKNCSGQLNDLTLQCGTPKDFNTQAQEWHDKNLKVLLGCASDNCSSISANNITSNFNFKTSTIPCQVNETVTYTINDDCGNNVILSLKITYKDNDAPQINLCTTSLSDTIECSSNTFDTVFNAWNAKNIATLQQCAKDLCDPNSAPLINANTFKYEQRCGNTGIAIMEYTAIDRCNNKSAKKIDTLIVRDTQKPFLFKGSIKNVITTCGNIPPKPYTEFRDQCSLNNVNVVYKEILPDVTQDDDFAIKRIWTVTDLCQNTNTFTQIIHIKAQTFLYNYDNQHCFDDGEINLNDYIPTTSNTYKNWTYVDGPLKNVNLKDGIFDPSNVDIDSLGIFTFAHTEPNGFCFNDTRVALNITDNCITYPCGPENFTFSKTVTPNGDAFNQYFTVIGSRECEFKINLKIFNRWGSIIYENPDYQNDWDASTVTSAIGNSGRVPNGTYYYVAELVDSGFDLFMGPIYIGTE